MISTSISQRPARLAVCTKPRRKSVSVRMPTRRPCSRTVEVVEARRSEGVAVDLVAGLGRQRGREATGPPQRRAQDRAFDVQVDAEPHDHVVDLVAAERALHQRAPHLLAADEDVIRPLDPRVSAEVLDRVGQGEGRDERKDAQLGRTELGAEEHRDVEVHPAG
jgi:hypothetical protein